MKSRIKYTRSVIEVFGYAEKINYINRGEYFFSHDVHDMIHGTARNSTNKICVMYPHANQSYWIINPRFCAA